MSASQLKPDRSVKKLTILLVDDAEDYRFLLRDEIEELLKNEQRVTEQDASIHDAGSGSEALKFLRENSVDIIVLDYEMPDMNGVDVLTQLKQLGVVKTAIGLTRYGEPILSSMVTSCALNAFCKDDRQRFVAYLRCRIQDLVH